MQVTISGAFFFSSMFPEANGKNSGLKNEEDQHNMASILSHLVSNKMSILALNYTFLGQNWKLEKRGGLVQGILFEIVGTIFYTKLHELIYQFIS